MDYVFDYSTCFCFSSSVIGTLEEMQTPLGLVALQSSNFFVSSYRLEHTFAINKTLQIGLFEVCASN